MARGFVSGVIWGGVVALGVAGVTSLLGPLPTPPEVGDAAPGVAQPPDRVVDADNGAAARDFDTSPPHGQLAPQTQAPEPDTLQAVDQGATTPAAAPETGAAAGLSKPAQPTEDVAVTLEADAPVLPNPQALAPIAPPAADAVSITTQPAQPPAPAVEAGEQAFASPDAADTPDDAPRIAASAIRSQEPGLQAKAMRNTLPAMPEPTEPDIAAATAPEPEPATPEIAIAPTAVPEPTEPDIATEAAPDPEPAEPEVATAPTAVPEPTEPDVVTEAAPEPEPAESEIASPADPEPEPTAPDPEPRTPQVAERPEPAPNSGKPGTQFETPPQIAAVAPPPLLETEAPQEVQDDTPQQTSSRPAIGIPATITSERDTGVKINRLPTASAAPQDTATDAASGTAGVEPLAINRYAQDFSNPDDKPLMGIVLIDSGSDLSGGEIGIAALRSFPYPISFAVDASLPDATDRMAIYRSEGFEVLAMVDLPKGATPADAEVSLADATSRLPEVVGVLEGTGAGLQPSRETADQVTAILAQSGHGLLTQDQGLNTMAKLAVKQGVAAAPIFRDFDSKGQTPTVMRRFLDQAAFKAGQEGAVIMLGRMRPDTISALLLWGLQDRANQVALAPISAVLLRQE